jgi:hypothetical protein
LQEKKELKQEVSKMNSIIEDMELEIQKRENEIEKFGE